MPPILCAMLVLMLLGLATALAIQPPDPPEPWDIEAVGHDNNFVNHRDTTYNIPSAQLAERMRGGGQPPAKRQSLLSFFGRADPPPPPPQPSPAVLETAPVPPVPAGVELYDKPRWDPGIRKWRACADRHDGSTKLNTTSVSYAGAVAKLVAWVAKGPDSVTAPSRSSGRTSNHTSAGTSNRLNSGDRVERLFERPAGNAEEIPGNDQARPKQPRAAGRGRGGGPGPGRGRAGPGRGNKRPKAPPVELEVSREAARLIRDIGNALTGVGGERVLEQAIGVLRKHAAMQNASESAELAELVAAYQTRGGASERTHRRHVDHIAAVISSIVPTDEGRAALAQDVLDKFQGGGTADIDKLIVDFQRRSACLGRPSSTLAPRRLATGRPLTSPSG
jgi:hypothetical protein